MTIPIKKEGFTLMLVSTKGRYALRIMLDLAQNSRGEYVVLMDVARRQNISEKYLESIVASLTKAGLLTGLRGRGGGYRLSKTPGEYSIGEILRATEGPLVPVSCLKTEENECPISAECLTLPLWQEVDRRLGSYLDSVTLEDLLRGTVA